MIVFQFLKKIFFTKDNFVVYYFIFFKLLVLDVNQKKKIKKKRRKYHDKNSCNYHLFENVSVILKYKEKVSLSIYKIFPLSSVLEINFANRSSKDYTKIFLNFATVATDISLNMFRTLF